MSFEALLPLTCTIRRNTPGMVDAHGHAAESWADYLTLVPCRLVSTGGSEKQTENLVVVADYKLICGADVDVTERDQVRIDSIDYNILLVVAIYGGAAIHHKELQLRMIR